MPRHDGIPPALMPQLVGERCGARRLSVREERQLRRRQRLQPAQQLTMVGMTGVMLIAKALEGPILNFAPLTMVAGIGIAMFTFGAIQIPRWARTRKKQMEEIAERVTQALPAPNT